MATSEYVTGAKPTALPVSKEIPLMATRKDIKENRAKPGQLVAVAVGEEGEGYQIAKIISLRGPAGQVQISFLASTKNNMRITEDKRVDITTLVISNNPLSKLDENGPKLLSRADIETALKGDKAGDIMGRLTIAQRPNRNGYALVYITADDLPTGKYTLKGLVNDTAVADISSAESVKRSIPENMSYNLLKTDLEN